MAGVWTKGFSIQGSWYKKLNSNWYTLWNCPD